MIREEMMHRMPAREFRDWQIYFALEPFGDRLVGSTLANINRGKDDPAIMPFEYLTQIGKDPQPTMRNAEQIHQAFLAFKSNYEAKQSEKLAN